MFKINAFYTATTVLLLFVNSALADNSTTNSYPRYENGVLTIPRIDTPDLPGTYQNATFQYSERGVLSLQSVEIARKISSIEQVKLVMTDSFPIQAFLNIQGLNNCETPGPINQRLNNNRIEVTVNVENSNVIVDCGLDKVNRYEKNIPLSIYGLTKGTYEYSVNGGNFVGKFTLANDNVLSFSK